MTEKSFKYDWQPHIQVIGRPGKALKAFVESEELLCLRQTADDSKMSSGSPLGISSSNGILSVIDQKGNLWLVGNIFCEPVNISELIRIKAKRVFLGQGQLLFENKRKGMVLITWASKPQFKQSKLRKIAVSHSTYSHLIDAYGVEQEIEEGSFWHYNSVKNLQYTIKLFQLNVLAQEILGFPSEKKIKMTTKPAGMSIGKYHGLVWSQQGQLYGWGCKNLALGLKVYEKNFYDELQEIELPEPIIKAVASTNYSLALGASGKIYEWGMQEGKEPILTPRELDIKGFKFIDIKGSGDYFGGLTSTNQLCLWGKGLTQLFGEEDLLFEQPFEMRKAKDIKIVDFELEENYLIALLIKDNGVLSKKEKNYFSEVIHNVTTQWFPNRVRSNITRQFQHHKKHISSPSSSNYLKQEDFIDRLIGDKISKDKYFCEMQDQKLLFKNLMTNTQPQALLKQLVNEPMKSTREYVKKPKRMHRKVQSTRETVNFICDSENADKLIKEFDDQQKHIKSRARRVRVPASSKTHKLMSYEQRRDAATERREEIINLKRCQTIGKRKTVFKEEVNPIFKSEDYLRTISQYFIKSFIIKLIKEPLIFAKHMKLKQRKSQQSFGKIANNMKNILGRQRALHFLKILEEEQPQRYQLMKRIIGGAMRRWKENKVTTTRKKIVNSLLFSILKKKIKTGLGKVWIQTRKIEKMTKWLSHQNNERFLHLRSLWKKTLLMYIKPTPSFENKNPTVCRQQLNCKPLFQKSKCLKLDSCLKASPICGLKLPFQVTFEKLEEIRNKSRFQQGILSKTQEPEIRKGVSWAEVSRVDWKATLNRDHQRKSTHISVHNGMVDILLYSYHHDCFFKPKNCQVNVPDNMKQSEKWVAEERRIFQKVIKDIMLEQWKEFWVARRDYELKLAQFVQDNYESLAEYRWKYILEFNQLKNHPRHEHIKKERELHRILSLIGAESILGRDVIPERYKTLQFISKVKGAPVAPVYETSLGHKLFKRDFKIYYETVLLQAKQIRKLFS